MATKVKYRAFFRALRRKYEFQTKKDETFFRFMSAAMCDEQIDDYCNEIISSKLQNIPIIRKWFENKKEKKHESRLSEIRKTENKEMQDFIKDEIKRVFSPMNFDHMTREDYDVLKNFISGLVGVTHGPAIKSTIQELCLNLFERISYFNIERAIVSGEGTGFSGEEDKYRNFIFLIDTVDWSSTYLYGLSVEKKEEKDKEKEGEKFLNLLDSDFQDSLLKAYNDDKIKVIQIHTDGVFLSFV